MLSTNKIVSRLSAVRRMGMIPLNRIPKKGGDQGVTSQLFLSSIHSRKFSSVIRRTIPLSMAKVEIMSFGKDVADIQSGILNRVLPVGSIVVAGDVVATCTIETTTDDTKDNQGVAIYAPKAGRIKEVYHQIKDSVKIGDYLMDIDDSIVQADINTLEEHLQKINSSEQQQQQQQRLPEDYMQSLLKMDDPSRIQTIIQYIPPQLQSNTLPLYERLLELQRDDPAELAKTHTQLAVLMYTLGDIQTTLQHLHQALELREQKLGKDHQQVAATCIHLGAMYRNSGDFETSLKYMLQALEIQKKNLGEEHPVVASSYNNIGALHYQSNDYARAIREYEKALTIHLKIHGEVHADTSGTYHNLGTAWKQLGDSNTALEYLQKALHVRQKQQSIFEEGEETTTGKTNNNDDRNTSSNNNMVSPDIAVSHTALGQLYAEMANYEASMEQYDAALAVQKQIYGPDSPMTATGYNNIGAIHYEKGSYNDAMKSYQTGLDILRTKEPNHTDTAASWNNVGLTYLRMGDPDKALEHHQEAIRILTDLFGPKHPNLAITIGSIGNVYKTQRLWEKALNEYEVAHELLETALGTSEHPDIASSYNNMALVLSQLPDRQGEALEKYRSATESFEKTLGSEHPHVAACRFNIALMLQTQGLKEDAKKEFELARDIWETSFGREHAHTEMAQKGVEECN